MTINCIVDDSKNAVFALREFSLCYCIADTEDTNKNQFPVGVLLVYLAF